MNVQKLQNREEVRGRRYCPGSYLSKLKLKRYANSTIKTYVSCFETFINHYSDREIKDLNEEDIRLYLQKLIRENFSHSYINQAINAIKFYYEVVLEMPNRFYSSKHREQSANFNLLVVGFIFGKRKKLRFKTIPSRPILRK
ncbi:hypothetical protein APR41_06230 [Salegentibacter salinarum]|uniref:Core-binding (CB) domain-containing protein n=1 Tax=Salegentibacter salinarum TaxID=447422 RepID=A0A2N0TQM3_9FLAO|nr:hypothetical protein APR41_06230 [Salegentibacter salinarum]